MHRAVSAGVWPSVVSRMTCTGVPSRRRRAGRESGGTSPEYSGGPLPRGWTSGDPQPTVTDRRHQKGAEGCCATHSAPPLPFFPRQGDFPCLGLPPSSINSATAPLLLSLGSAKSPIKRTFYRERERAKPAGRRGLHPRQLPSGLLPGQPCAAAPRGADTARPPA